MLPAWLTEHDVDVYAEAFEKGGFFGPVSFYRNIDANWERAKDLPASLYTMPTAFITGSLDPVNFMMPGAAEEMAAALPDFRAATVVEGAGHWVQQEKPAETNAALWSSSPARDERSGPPPRRSRPGRPGRPRNGPGANSRPVST